MSAFDALIPTRVKGRAFARLRPVTDVQIEALRGQRKVFVGLAGFYQNLGDLAITRAQIGFIKTVLPDHVVVPIASTATYRSANSLRRAIEPGDVATLIGGGNMGDLYGSLEDARLYLVRLFSAIPLVSFPQSWCFTETPQGRRALARSARAYRKHRDLVLFARESVSLASMRGALPGVRVELAPDIVLSHRIGHRAEPREGLLVCLRDDLEGVLDERSRSRLIEALTAAGEPITMLDTVWVTLEDCTPDRYEATIDDFLSLVQRHRVVVTDRLHCMIFCAITGTPCVVLPNNTGKITGTYRDWLASAPFLELVTDPRPGPVLEAIAKLATGAAKQEARPALSVEFQQLREALIHAAYD